MSRPIDSLVAVRSDCEYEMRELYPWPARTDLVVANAVAISCFVPVWDWDEATHWPMFVGDAIKQELECSH